MSQGGSLNMYKRPKWFLAVHSQAAIIEKAKRTLTTIVVTVKKKVHPRVLPFTVLHVE
jgi:hypothetical protein